MDNDNVVSTLNELIETCRDGQKGFRDAADAVKNPQLGALFEEYSLQRQQFARDLQQEVSRVGGEPAESGSVGAAAHRGWMNLKAAITGGSDKAIISECERGEDAAVKSYRDALAEGLPSGVRTLVMMQAEVVQQTHDRIRGLELAAEADEEGTRTTHGRPM